MAGKSDNSGKGKGNRGTSNELELLKMIISENIHLQRKVLDKLRVLKGSNKANLIDEVKTKKIDAQKAANSIHKE